MRLLSLTEVHITLGSRQLVFFLFFCGGGGVDPQLRSHLDRPLLKMKLCDARLGVGGGELLLLKLPLDAGQTAGQRAGLGLIHHLQAEGKNR